jgi:hypothetical protein
VRLPKSGLPMIIATIGMTRLSTSELMTAANATPITNATASSTMFPRNRKFFSSSSTAPPFDDLHAVTASHSRGHTFGKPQRAAQASTSIDISGHTRAGTTTSIDAGLAEPRKRARIAACAAMSSAFVRY